MARVLLDTNILIHREAAVAIREDVGTLFYWLDKLRYDKCVHPLSLQEIAKHRDERVRNTFRTKLKSYHELKTSAPLSPAVRKLSSRDRTQNDRNDTLLVNELQAGRVDILITEDQGIHAKAEELDLAESVFTIEKFLEKATAENPDLVDYKVLAVRRAYFGEVDVNGPFFDSLRAHYGAEAFNRWYNSKADETAYVCFQGESLVAFLYVKMEGSGETYADIHPRFLPRRRLKIGTFKVELNGFRLGERFLKIVFDNAIHQRVDEIYVTMFERTLEQQRLQRLLTDFGFIYHGAKHSVSGTENVYVRDMRRRYDRDNPRSTYPFVSLSSRTFLVPIYPEYHTSLLPDSILRTESPDEFVEQEPHRNAIIKVYISRSMRRDLRRGDTLVFYRTGGYYKAVVTTIGIVEECITNLRNEEHFVRECRKLSVFSDDELREQWRYKRTSRPFIVEFLYSYSFPKRPNLKELIENGVVSSTNSAPRGFEEISRTQFDTILSLSRTDTRIIVD